MSVDFSIISISEKPKKKTHQGRKGSKYEPILTAFLESGHSLVRVDGTDKEANFLAMILKRLIKKRGDSVTVTIRNGKVYLEK